MSKRFDKTSALFSVRMVDERTEYREMYLTVVCVRYWLSFLQDIIFAPRLEHRGYFFQPAVFLKGTWYSFSGFYGYVKIFIPRFHAQPDHSFTICLFHRSRWNFQSLLHNVAQSLLVRIAIMVPHTLTGGSIVWHSRVE